MNLLYKNSKNVQELYPKDFKVSNLNSSPKLNKKMPHLTIYYAHWCPHCHSPEMIEFVEALGQSLPKKAGINVNAFNCEYNNSHQEIAQNMDISGFPTIRYTNSNGKMNDYMGPREVEPLILFLIKNS